ncbi:MAG: DUF1801 domain-containing protein [Chloroflexota bacterium]|nr:MAG: DUF1801 domain-containing protein [Chloroflexota bacterium]
MPQHATVDAYMAAVPEKMRAALADLRATIRSAAPEAEEVIAYDMPAYRLNGKFVVSFSAFKNHCSLFPASGAVMAKHGDVLRPHLSGKATLRFDPAKPIPPDVIANIVRIRLAEVGGE